MDKRAKQLIGERIRVERTKRGQSRQQICRDEKELSVKQLMRIEQGKSLPTIVTLTYLSEAFELPISHLLAEHQVEIPEDYLEAKYHLIKSRLHPRITRQAKMQLLTTIYDTYFDCLPDEELLCLDIVERMLEFQTIGESLSMAELFGDFFEQSLTKTVFTLNDLLLLNYYAIQCQGGLYQHEVFVLCCDRLLQQEFYGDELLMMEMLMTLFSFADVCVSSQFYPLLAQLISKMQTIITETLDYYYQPRVWLFEAIYQYRYQKDDVAAKRFCEKARQFAQLIADDGLVTFIQEEIEQQLPFI